MLPSPCLFLLLRICRASRRMCERVCLHLRHANGADESRTTCKRALCTYFYFIFFKLSLNSARARRSPPAGWQLGAFVIRPQHIFSFLRPCRGDVSHRATMEDLSDCVDVISPQAGCARAETNRCVCPHTAGRSPLNRDGIALL